MKHLSINETISVTGGTDMTASRFVPIWHHNYYTPVYLPELPSPPMVPPAIYTHPPTIDTITPPATPLPTPIALLPVLISPLPPTP